MNRAIVAELVHLVAGLLVTRLVFVAAEWAYPQGAESLEVVGWITMAAVLAMSVAELRNAWKHGNARD